MLEMDQMLIHEIQTMYRQFWRDKMEEKKMSKTMKAGAALDKALDDHL